MQNHVILRRLIHNSTYHTKIKRFFSILQKTAYKNLNKYTFYGTLVLHTVFCNTLEWLDRGYALRLQWLFRDFQLFWWLNFCINIKLHMSTQHLFNSKTNSLGKLKWRVFKGRQSWVFRPCCKNRKITWFL